MTFESDIASLNEHFFFKAFTYSTNTFGPSPSTQLELADSIVWLGDTVIVFQLKERDVSTATTLDNLLIHESPLTDALFLLVSKSDEVTTT